MNSIVVAFAPALPFVGLLMSIALLPLLFSAFWHRHEKNILVFWGVSGLTSILSQFSGQEALHHLMESLWGDYLPFIAIAVALFTVAGGIHLSVGRVGCLAGNILLFAMAAVCASFIGTTGTSMLFIRPLLRLNKHRKFKTHIVVFFIVVVSNISGGLTPLGDPPLFLGYLEGVPFMWTLVNLWQPVLFMLLVLFAVFYCVDAYFYAKEPIFLNSSNASINVVDAGIQGAACRSVGRPSILRIKGGWNIALLVMIVFFVVLLQKLPNTSMTHCFGVALAYRDLFFLVSMGLVGSLSYHFTPAQIHHSQHFNFAPVFEVARVFLCIFVTLIPLNHLLSQGAEGPFYGALRLLDTAHPARLYFWMTGFFSSFLDNAPTYLVFLKLAGGDIAALTTTKREILSAISLGSVFMGALTYIGNAPNMMVLSIAKQHNVRMPSFLQYTGWVCLLLIPLFLVMSWIWF